MSASEPPPRISRFVFVPVLSGSLLVELAACGGSDPKWDLRARPADQQPDAGVELRFAWPVPASARVREQVRTPASAFALRYRIRLVEAADGDTLLLHTTDVELEHIDGRVPATDADREAVAPALEALASAMPTIRVSRDGAFLGVPDLDEWAERAAQVVDRQIEQIPEGIEGRDDAVRVLRARAEMMRSRTMRPALEESAGERWEAWVACWRGVRGKVGDETERTTSVTLPWAPLGVDIELLAVVRGFVFHPESAVRVEMVADVDPENTSTGIELALARTAGQDFSGTSARFGRGAVVDPGSMLPLYVESRLRVRRPGGEEAIESNDLRIWDFEWESPAAPFE